MVKARQSKLLVAVDGSQQALDAVRYVSGVLPADHLQVTLFHVMTKVPESFWDLEKEPAFHYKIANIRAWEIQQQKTMHDFMDQARQILLDAGLPQQSIVSNIKERKTGIARDIVAESKHGYQAVIVGRTGLSELKDLVLGSIANKLVERVTYAPVWIVGGAPQPGKLLIALDSSKGAMQAVDYVGTMLDGSTQSVTLIHVVRGVDIFLQSQSKSFVPGHDKDWLEQAEKELEETTKAIEPVFADARERLLQAGLHQDKISTRIITGVRSRAGAIVREADQEDYGTIVVGRRGLSKVQEFFIGRVGNKVIQLAKKKAVWVVS
jgi:nucleotide-binding universal stress UspA family protein